MDRPEWISRAKQVDAVSVDIGFLISESFYHGPENGFTEEQWQKLREPLYQPRLERYGDFVLSSEIGQSAAELVRYYQDVLRLISQHRKELGQKSQYFWMRPLIFAPGEFAITFPWYDTWQEATRMLEALAGGGDGLLFHDMDQGWEVQVFADDDRLVLRQGDFDTGEDHFVVATNRARLVGQVPALRERVVPLLSELSAALGRDYWSRR